MPSPKLRTCVAIVADDRPMVLAGLGLALEGDPPSSDAPISVQVTSFSAAPQAVDEGRPDVLVVPIRSGDPEPYRVIATAKALHDELRVLALIDEVSGTELREAVIAGADGFVVTRAPLAEIRDAVVATARGERVVSADVAIHLVGLWRSDGQRSGSPSVTPREMHVLELLTEGLTNREIAERLDLSPRTVKTHVQNLITKLEVPDRTGAVARAFRLGLVR